MPESAALDEDQQPRLSISRLPHFRAERESGRRRREGSPLVRSGSGSLVHFEFYALPRLDGGHTQPAVSVPPGRDLYATASRESESAATSVTDPMGLSVMEEAEATRRWQPSVGRPGPEVELGRAAMQRVSGGRHPGRVGVLSKELRLLGVGAKTGSEDESEPGARGGGRHAVECRSDCWGASPRPGGTSAGPSSRRRLRRRASRPRRRRAALPRPPQRATMATPPPGAEVAIASVMRRD